MQWKYDSIVDSFKELYFHWKGILRRFFYDHVGSANSNIDSVNSSLLNDKGTKLKVCKDKYYKKDD